MSTSVLLVYGIDAEWEALPDREQAGLEEGHRTLTAAAGSATRLIGARGPGHRSTTLRADGTGASLAGPGPCFDAAASIGGFHLLEAVEAEEAQDLAGDLDDAAAKHSAIEVRRVVGAQ